MAARLLEERNARILDRSPVYETEPWGNSDLEPFLNQALLVETSHTAPELMQEILHIENLMGRTRRKERLAPRTIDIDIVFFNHQIIHREGLVVPHPSMAERRFVLAPLNDIAPAYIHPVLFRTVRELLEACTDPLGVKKR